MSTPFALTHVSVVTGDTAGTVRPDQTIVVDAHGRIELVGPTAEVELPAGLLRVDGTGKFVSPGLINAHAHLFADGKPLPAIYTRPRTTRYVAWFMRSPAGQALLRKRARENATTQLHTGVTTMRTVGDVMYEVVTTRNAIESGELTGPRLLPSGPLMAITGGHGAPTIALIGDDPQTARANTRRNLQHGAEAIKISATGGVTDAIAVGYAGKPEMPEASMRAVCEEAHEAGVLVAAHAQSTEGVRAALRAGVDTIEHGSSMDEELIGLYLDNPASLRGRSAMIPTLQACLPLVKLDPSISGATEIVRENAKLVLEEMLSGIRSAAEHGILLGVGTDSGVSYVTHSNFWREMDLTARYAGLDPAAVLSAATRGNAEILGLTQVTGEITPGKDADLVVTEANPLEGFRTFSAPWMVVARGERIVHPEVSRIAEIDAHLDTL